MKYIHLNIGLSKETIIPKIVNEIPTEVDLTEKEIDQL